MTPLVLLAGLLALQTPAPPAAGESAPSTAPASQAAPTIPPIIAAQIESYELREQLYAQTLTILRERLDAAISSAIPGWRVDWTTKRWVPNAPAPTAPDAAGARPDE
jgi:hypothetical protein